MSTEIRPRRIHIPQARLDDLADRLARTQWPAELPGGGDSHGVSAERVRALAKYWQTEFDWRALEHRLNSYQQFVTEIDGEEIHFLHIRSARPDALPLILTHGWPGTVVEYLDVIAPLASPGSDEQAYHLVIPSLPGSGFSGPTRSTGWGTARTARAWAELMHRLGYRHYGAVGNDAGSMISPAIGRLDPEHVVGVHVTQVFSFPSGDPNEFAGLSEADHAALAYLEWFQDNKYAFNLLHGQQPQTIAYALSDSPVGLLGWQAQLFGGHLDPDFVLANVSIHWLTGTAASAIRFYYEDAHARTPRERSSTPIGLAMFAGDFQSIRAFAERDHTNIVSWNSYDLHLPSGGPTDVVGHYSAHEAPEMLVADIRQFFNTVMQAPRNTEDSAKLGAAARG